MFQGKVAEREVQDEVFKSEKKKENRVQSDTETLELRSSKKQGGHGNVMAAENEILRILNLKQIRILHPHQQPDLESKQ